MESTEGGTIPENQGALLRKVFTFSDRVTHEIMVPRNRIAAININEPVNQVLDQVFSTVTPPPGQKPRPHPLPPLQRQPG